MRRIYVSYRRKDTSESYDRIVERLRGYFGSEAVLRSDSAYTTDGATIAPAEYRAYVAGAMKRCAALLLIIGPRWLESDNPGGWSLSDLDDPVRIEIEAALREGVPIVPALVQQGRMPREDELPASLRLLLEQDQEHTGRRGRESLLSLVSRSGLQVRRDPDFGGDVLRLCEVIENLAGLEAASLERASGAINRTLRNVTLAASATLIAHALFLAYFANQVVVPLKPTLVIPTGWLPTIIITSLIDWGVYFLASYVVGRRTGDVGLGVSAAVASYVAGLVVGIVAFADIAWTNWISLSGPIATPDILIGAPDWLLAPSLLLMRPFILLFTLFVLGIPLGLLVSFALGSLGGILGVRVTEFITGRQWERQRAALIQREEEAKHGQGRAFFPLRGATSGQTIRRRATPAGKVFISYRRDDSAVMCGSIYDRLADIFGVDTVFKDVDMIPVGVNFEKYISSTLEKCVAQVVVIGPRWVSIATSQGVPRLDDPKDFVRLEVESALRSGIRVIPVLVQGATMPTSDELPESLRPLADLEPIIVRYAPNFDSDMRDLSLELAPIVWPKPARGNLLKRAPSMRLVAGGTQVWAFLWLALFLLYGLILGKVIVHSLSQSSVSRQHLLLAPLGTAPLILSVLGAISGAHLGFLTGKTGRAFWLAWRAVLLSCAALTFTIQASGITLFSSLYLAVQNTYYRQFTTSALVAAAAIALGPGLITTLLGAAISAFVRGRWKQSGILRVAPRSLQVLYNEEDAAASVRITRGLVSFFGSHVIPPKSLRLQTSTPRASVTQRIATSIKMRIAPLILRRSLVSDLEDRNEGTSSSSVVGLTRALRRTAAMLVLVGPSWGADGDVLARMRDPENPLRVRIETALALGQPIIPVLLTGATMPSPDRLPVSLHEFAMLNAAWVRDDPDFSGDMRRLTRVIERLTRLREGQKPLVSLIPILLGAILSGLILMGIDALMGWLLLDTHNAPIQLAAPNQTALFVMGAAVVAIELLINGMTAAEVTIWSGKRLNGALAALLGASFAMLASVRAFFLLQSLLSPTEVAYVIDASHAFNVFTLNALSLLLVTRLPFQTLGAIAASALGSFYGRIAYRGRERRKQERRLYEMARSVIQSEPLAELSARSARATGGITTRPVTPEATALAASVVDFEPKNTVEPAALATNETPEKSSEIQEKPILADSEDSRREKLLAEMRSARLRARRQAQIRLGGIVGLGIAGLLIVSLVTEQTLSSQAGAVNASATAAIDSTSTAVNAPSNAYSDTMPGPTCSSISNIGKWVVMNSNPDAAISCLGPSIAFFTSNNHPAMLALFLNYLYAPKYELRLDMDFLTFGTCGGLVSSGQGNSSGSSVAYIVCNDGSWSITKCIGGIAANESLASGHIPNLKTFNTFHLLVRVSPDKLQFSVNNNIVSTIATDKESMTTVYTGIYLSSGYNGDQQVGAEVSDFYYAPTPGVSL
jgi:hypothetical protein